MENLDADAHKGPSFPRVVASRNLKRFSFGPVESVECSVGNSKTMGDLEIVKYRANGTISNLQIDVLEADGASRFELLEKVIGRSNLA